MYYADDTVKKLKSSKDIVIYGARIVANEVASCLMAKPYCFQIRAFMVSEMKGNPTELLGIEVIDIREGIEKYKHATVIIAVLEKYVDQILENLHKAGFSNIILMTFESDLWSEIRGNYYKEYIESKGKKYLTLEEELNTIELINREVDRTKVSVYRACCHVDRSLKTDFSKYDWEKTIQVGRALTNETIPNVEITDNTGHNISIKNRQYCELTALYWIWKNDKTSKYTGLCHYRRHFKMKQEDIKKLENSDIDVILTIPILNFPSVRATYEKDHLIEDWDIMLSAISILSPEYSKTAKMVEEGNYYYAYNMFIAKKEIFDVYCEWLFPILEYCERSCEVKKDTYQARYIGFLAERLLSIFFIHNRDKWKIVHAQKEFFMR